MFLAWLLQNVVDYTRDSRVDLKQVNVFTLNGQHKEMSFILRAMVSIAG